MELQEQASTTSIACGGFSYESWFCLHGEDVFFFAVLRV